MTVPDSRTRPHIPSSKVHAGHLGVAYSHTASCTGRAGMANDEEMALTALREELERVTAEKDAVCRELETLNAREEVTRVEVDHDGHAYE